jgi:hypothetical protein
LEFKAARPGRVAFFPAFSLLFLDLFRARQRACSLPSYIRAWTLPETALGKVIAACVVLPDGRFAECTERRKEATGRADGGPEIPRLSYRPSPTAYDPFIIATHW